MCGKWFITELYLHSQNLLFILALETERELHVYRWDLWTSNPLWGGTFEKSSLVYQRNLGTEIVQTAFWEGLLHITLNLRDILRLKLEISCILFQWWNKHLCLLCTQDGSWGRECLTQMILSSKESAVKVRLQQGWFYAECTETWLRKKPWPDTLYWDCVCLEGLFLDIIKISSPIIILRYHHLSEMK